MNDNLINAAIYLGCAAIIWRFLHARCLTSWLRMLLLITFVWGIAGASASLHY